MPSILWAGTAGHNVTAGRSGQAPTAISNHVMLGTLVGTRSAFADPAHQASAHYGIGADGTILQFVQDSDMAWANGPIRRPNLAAVPWLAECSARHINPNWRTISIEWEGRHLGGTWTKVLFEGKWLDTLKRGTIRACWAPTPAQYAAGLWLHQQLIARHGIVRDRAHITRHSDYDSVTKWFCPGDGFPMARLIADLGGHL